MLSKLKLIRSEMSKLLQENMKEHLNSYWYKNLCESAGALDSAIKCYEEGK